jgi:hypothetical protein
MLFVFFPSTFILFAPYPEGLFLLWAALCFLWARQGKWWWAGVAGGLATLTRQQGIFLLFPMAWELWEATGRAPRRILPTWRSWLAITTIPAGLLVWVIYRAVALGNIATRVSHIPALIYSLFVSPSANKVATFHVFTWPWRAIGLALSKLGSAPDIDLWTNLILAGTFLAFLAASWHSMCVSYRIYATVISLVSFCYHTGPIHPYMGLPRHLLLAFPVFIGLAPRCTRAGVRLSITVLSVLGMMFLLFAYVMEAWVP